VTTASAVPETYSLEGDDAMETLRRVGWSRLARDTFTRFRTADGFSHTRAAAHAAVLTAFPMLIFVIGVASVFHLVTFRNVLEHTLLQLAPGPAGRLLSTAFREGSESGGGAALLGGLLGVLFSGMFAMAQVERGCNRIYGMVRDRKISHKLGFGLLLYVSAGVLLAIAFVLLAVGRGLENGLARAGWGDTPAAIFGALRWPAGLLLTFVALTVIYKFSPNRRQPGAAWLQTGTITATLMWVIFTVFLALYYGFSESLGSTYGPLLGVIAILVWAYATALALFFGIALAAQLEASRAGVPGPRTLRRYNEIVRHPDETANLDEVLPRAAPSEPSPGLASSR
jgi:YihY family inner membrane protein